MNVETHLIPDPISARAAREVMEAALQPWGDADAIEVAVLLTTELVTNAIVHARTDFALRVGRDEGLLRVEVSDSSPEPPRLVAIHGLEDHGRGLHLVDALSDSWGVDWGDDLKTVWFELTPRPHDVRVNLV